MLLYLVIRLEFKGGSVLAKKRFKTSMNIDHCKLINLPKFSDERGFLSFAEGKKHIPFEIKRMFYLYDIAQGASRGAHAHKWCQQFILSFGGKLTIEVDDGRNKRHFQLSHPWEGLYIPSMVWTTLTGFESNSVCVVLASDVYDEMDYYRNYADFLSTCRNS